MTIDSRDLFTLRPAQPDDAEAVSRLCDQLGYPASEEEVRRRLVALGQDEEHVVLVAETRDGAVCGWMHAYIRKLVVRDPHIEIGGLVVDEAQRGKGAGRLLMAEAERWAQDRGCRGVYLRSNVKREEAHRFYEEIGYRRLKTSFTLAKDLPE